MDLSRREGTMSVRKEMYIDLNTVNDKFTEEVLTSILAKVCKGEEKVRLINWSFDENFAIGDCFTSSINKGNVTGVIDGSLGQRCVRVNFIVKTMPKNIGRRKTMRSADFFRNEIIFYTEARLSSTYFTHLKARICTEDSINTLIVMVASRFEKFLAYKRQSHFLSIPRYLVSFMDGENDFLVLEDASCLGFGPASRQNCLDLTECTVILKTMAKFHAISFAYKDQKKKEYAAITSHMKEIFYDKNYWDWLKKHYKNVLDVGKHALTTEYPGSKAEKHFNSYRFDVFYDKCVELCYRQDAPTSVVCEGDCWAPNFMVRDVRPSLKEVLVLDFQLSRCASLVTDLSFLIYSCTTKTFRDQHFDDMLKTYHSELSNAIKLLGSDPEHIYPWDLFMKEVKDQFFFGLFDALKIILLNIMEISPSVELNNKFLDDDDDEVTDIGEVFKFFNIETASGRQRLADVIVHAVDHGFLPYAENFEAS